MVDICWGVVDICWGYVGDMVGILWIYGGNIMGIYSGDMVDIWCGYMMGIGKWDIGIRICM